MILASYKGIGVRKAAALLAAAAVFLAAPSPIGAENYHIGSGDVVRIEVWREADLTGEYAVGPRGVLHFPLLGEVNAAGKTARELQDELRGALGRDYLVDPVVSVTVSVYQSHKVFVFGHVTRPGLYYLKEDPSFLKILLEAGGPASAGAGSASILRFKEVPAEGGSPLQHLRVDLQALFSQGDLSQDVDLEASDIVFINSPGNDKGLIGAGNQIFVLGEVKSPGTYQWHEGYTALNAVLDAGGLTEFAAGNRARLVRGEGENRQVLKVPLGDVVEGDLEKNVQLKPGDLISIPESFF